MNVFIKNDVTLQNELIILKEDVWAYVYAGSLFSLVAFVLGGTALLFV